MKRFAIFVQSGDDLRSPPGEEDAHTTDNRFPDRRSREELSYVVLYEFDDALNQGFVYLPGRRDEWYPTNVRHIYRGREGNWFQATRHWDGVSGRRLVRRALAGRE